MSDHLDDYTREERRLFAALPKTKDVDPRLENAVVTALQREGLLRSSGGRRSAFAFVALAATLVLAAWLGGVRWGAQSARADSIEGLLARADLSASERVLLMQRAGSAYVAATNQYVASVDQVDAVAAEVSSRTLLGAAQAVARARVNGPLATRIAAIMGDARGEAGQAKPVIWY